MFFSKPSWHFVLLVLFFSPVHAVTDLYQDDFTWGTYIITKPGHYRLAEDIRFAPNSVATLTSAVADGTIPAPLAQRLGLPLTGRVPAALSGSPLPTQFKHGPNNGQQNPAGPVSANYDPAAYGLGFFAAIVVTANNVVLDLNGHTIEQSAEHALLQRFFSVIELAEQPFIPAQGPANFGESIASARNVVIRNGTIGRSAHHGIHGNGNRNVVVANVDFVGYEVAALALNGVRGLLVANANATNRKDVPVLGTFSAARFIAPYLQDLVRRNSSTQLQVNGQTLTAATVLEQLHSAINNVYEDVIAGPSSTDYPQINPVVHPNEYELFHNPLGLVDGNSYSFLVNNVGVAVNGFPSRDADNKSRLAIFHNVKVRDQEAFINEIVALKGTAGAATDPIGAVWQLHNRHPETGTPITLMESTGSTRYQGNVLANAQALVAKAIHAGEFAASNLDTSRNSITPEMVRWVEAAPGFEALEQLSAGGPEYLCNGDSMFHVNKGVIGYNISAINYTLLSNTSVMGLRNLGAPGSTLCGDYSNGLSHPMATLPGYGGGAARGYAFAGAKHVSLNRTSVKAISAVAGNVSGIDFLTDSKRAYAKRVEVQDLSAGLTGAEIFEGPNPIPTSAAIRVGSDTKKIRVQQLCANELAGFGGGYVVIDDANQAQVQERCAGRGKHRGKRALF